jgi:hypothetical protein
MKNFIISLIAVAFIARPDQANAIPLGAFDAPEQHNY